MAKIENVDYKDIPSKTKQMLAKAKDLNSEITSAYKSVSEMHTNWYGQRYNTLVKAFNKMTKEINEMLKLVVSDIPDTLNTIANNYSQADTGSKLATPAKESPNKISDITESTDVGMKFMTEQVANTQTSVSNNFKKATTLMNEIETEYGKIDWNSEAANAFRTKFSKLKADIVKSFDDIESQFTKLMNQTKDDMQKTETANTVQ